MADEPTADLVGRQLGEFILRKKIGEGGCAVVYRSAQPALKRDVVVKVLHARRRRNDTAQERFFREAQLASQLDHPYAAHVYAFGEEEDGLLWIAMELVHGITLGDWLAAHGPMPLKQFVPIMASAAPPGASIGLLGDRADEVGGLIGRDGGRTGRGELTAAIDHLLEHADVGDRADLDIGQRVAQQA